MTVEKAIEILSDVGDINRCCAEDAEALDMAIKALEQQPCEDCISREAVDEYITNLLSGYLYDEERTRLEDLTAYIWELPSVIPQPCEEAISRQAVMNIISFEYGWLIDAKEYNTNIRIAFNGLRSRVKALPSVTPKAESKDVLAEIKAEIEQKCCITVGSENEPAITLYDVFQIIDKYRTESKDKPKGRWIDIGDEGLVFKCSICGTKKTIESHYCPNCGAKMAESEE